MCSGGFRLQGISVFSARCKAEWWEGSSVRYIVGAWGCKCVQRMIQDVHEKQVLCVWKWTQVIGAGRFTHSTCWCACVCVCVCV